MLPAAPTDSTSIMLLNRCRQSGERVLLWNADWTQPETAAITSAGPTPVVSIATKSAANDVDIVAHPRASGT